MCLGTAAAVRADMGNKLYQQGSRKTAMQNYVYLKSWNKISINLAAKNNASRGTQLN